MPHFVIFLFAGLLLWNLFPLGVQTGTGVVVNNAGIVKKVSFPREILALAAVGSACVFFFFQAIVMVIFLVALHIAARPGATYRCCSWPSSRASSSPRPSGAALVDQRVPARHPAPDRGHPHGLVLGLPDRVLVPEPIANKLGPRADLGLLPESR